MRIPGKQKSFVFTVWVLVISNVILNSPPAIAEYVPQNTSRGKVISVGACLPESAKSPIYLQTWFESYKKMKTVAKITFSKLVYDESCETTAPSSGNYRLSYKWKVNVRGEHFLSFYVPNLNESFDGWPDGVKSK